MAVREDFGFLEWLQDTFADESTEDVFLSDQSMALFSPLDGSSNAQQMLPDPAQLIFQMQEPIAADMDTVLPQNSTDRSQDSRQTSQGAKGARPKNTKRYKSTAQKEAHKRYRERKRQNITAMEEEVQQKLLLLQKLETENQQLKSKMRMLETSVNCSTQIHGLMQLLDSMDGMSLNSSNSSATSSSQAADGTADLQSHPSHSTSSTNGTTAAADATAAAVAACCGCDAPNGGSQQQLLQALQQVKQEYYTRPDDFMLIQQQQQQQVQQQLPQIQQNGNYVPQQRVVTTSLQGLVNGTAEAGAAAAAAAGNSSAVQPGQLFRTNAHSWGSASNNTLQAAAIRCAASGTAAGLGEAAAIAAASAAPGPSTYSGMRVSNNGAWAGGTSGLWVSTAAEVLQPAIPSTPGSAEQPGSSGSDSLQAIFAEAQQQQQQHNGCGVLDGTAAGDAAVSAGSPTAAAAAAAPPDPLAGAASTLEQSMVMYKEFLQKATLLMQQLELGTPDVAAAAQVQLDALTRTTISRIQPFLVAKGQGVVYDWLTRNLETFQQQEPPGNLWPCILSHMRLTQQQQQDALACYRMFGVCLSKLVDKRLALTAQYKALQQQGEQLSLHSQQGQREEAAAEQRQVKINSASMEVLQCIAKSLAAYQSLDGVFAHSVTSIFAGWQMGVAMVHSYPFLPNWHKIMHYLHQQDEQLQEQQAQQQQLQQQQQKPATRRSGRHTQGSQLGVQHAVKA